MRRSPPISRWQRELSTASERLAAQQDAFDRLVIRAPVAGTVMDLAVHTVGAVVKPGDALMNIVPDTDAMIVKTGERSLMAYLVRPLLRRLEPALTEH